MYTLQRLLADYEAKAVEMEKQLKALELQLKMKEEDCKRYKAQQSTLDQAAAEAIKRGKVIEELNMEVSLLKNKEVKYEKLKLLYKNNNEKMINLKQRVAAERKERKQLQGEIRAAQQDKEKKTHNDGNADVADIQETEPLVVDINALNEEDEEMIMSLLQQYQENEIKLKSDIETFQANESKLLEELKKSKLKEEKLMNDIEKNERLKLKEEKLMNDIEKNERLKLKEEKKMKLLEQEVDALKTSNSEELKKLEKCHHEEVSGICLCFTTTQVAFICPNIIKYYSARTHTYIHQP
jgi:hypothetical protein